MGLAPEFASGGLPYNGTLRASLRRLSRRLGLAVALAAALSGGGCSFSYQLGSLFEKKSDAAAVEQTGSVGALAVAETAEAKPLPEEDLAYARIAALDVLTRGGKGASQPWENPRTGARGTVTPVASARTEAGITCQDFLASYLREGSGESWLQGEGCRPARGRWEVRSLKPWKKSS